jgi:hypothetical protein
MTERELPLVDEHALTLGAPGEAAWEAILDVARRSFSGSPAELLAGLLGCEERRAGGSPGELGSTVPGFRVARSVPPRELALRGRHRFSEYSLVFRVDDLGGGRSRVRAETRAEFPGRAGAVYRALVIGTRGHRVAVRRILRAVARRAARD